MCLVIYFERWAFASVRFRCQLPLRSLSTKPSPSHHGFHVHGKIQEYNLRIKQQITVAHG